MRGFARELRPYKFMNVINIALPRMVRLPVEYLPWTITKYTVRHDPLAGAQRPVCFLRPYSSAELFKERACRRAFAKVPALATLRGRGRRLCLGPLLLVSRHYEQ